MLVPLLTLGIKKATHFGGQWSLIDDNWDYPTFALYHPFSCDVKFIP